ncbi:MAG: MBL fold metallo-hydrolase [Oscillospiraceae bacterium]
MSGYMYPINGRSKAKRILWGGRQNHISWAYMKELRENRPCQVFDCNPYVEVYQFRDNLYGLFNQNCDGAGDVWMWLTIGPEKCFLIDTAYGLGDIKGVVDKLSGGKEIIVVNTHDHFDHAFGNCRFERVCCHEALVPLLQAQNEHMWDYLFDKDGNNIWLQFDREDLPKFKPYEIVGVPDGFTWDLGDGYEIELINSNGHGGAGASMYLDKANRILFPGDNICSDVSGCGSVSYPIEECSLYKYRECVRKLVDRMDEYDYIFPMHFMCNLESNLMTDILDALDEVLKDPEHNYDYEMSTVSPNGGAPSVRKYKYIKGFSVMAYQVFDKAPPLVPSALKH